MDLLVGGAVAATEAVAVWLLLAWLAARRGRSILVSRRVRWTAIYLLASFVPLCLIVASSMPSSDPAVIAVLLRVPLAVVAWVGFWVARRREEDSAERRNRELGVVVRRRPMQWGLSLTLAVVVVFTVSVVAGVGWTLLRQEQVTPSQAAEEGVSAMAWLFACAIPLVAVHLVALADRHRLHRYSVAVAARRALDDSADEGSRPRTHVLHFRSRLQEEWARPQPTSLPPSGVRLLRILSAVAAVAAAAGAALVVSTASVRPSASAIVAAADAPGGPAFLVSPLVTVALLGALAGAPQGLGAARAWWHLVGPRRVRVVTAMPPAA